MNILHARTSPDLLARLRQMLASAHRADIAVGYFFISGFAQTTHDFARLSKTRILVGQADRPTLEAIAAGMRQADPLRSRLHSHDLIPRSRRDTAASDAAANISHGIAALDQTDDTASAIDRLRALIASGLMEIRAYPRGFMRAKPTSAGTPTTTPNPAPPSWAHPTSPSQASAATPNSTSASPATPKCPPSKTGSTRSGQTP